MFNDQVSSACRVFVLVLMLAQVFLPGVACAGEKEDRRAWAGLDLFPSLLAADENISEKHGPDGKLLLVLVCEDRGELAEEMALHLGKIGKIRGIPIRVEVSEAAALTDYETIPVGGIFLTRKLSDELDAILRFGKTRQIIVFSPFRGDVERGASGGILVSDRILPYVNMETMRQSGIQIKPFFLRITEQYE